MEAQAHANGWLGRPALHADGRSVTHAQVHDLVARTGALLRSLGVGQGDRVLIVAADSVEFAAAFLGALRIGAVPAMVNPLLTPREHHVFVEDVSPAAVIIDAALADRFAGAGPGLLLTEELVGRAAALDPAPPAILAPDAPGYVQYTSGTTGQPKGAVHRQRDELAYYQAVAEGVYGLRSDDVTLCVSRMFFAYGLPSSVLHPLMSGSSAVILKERPTPEVVTDLCARHGVTILLSVPTFLANLVDRDRAEAFRTVRFGVSGGEPLLPRLKADAEALLGCPVLNHLGSTEVGHGYAGDVAGSYRAGTCGRAFPPYRVAVRDAGDQQLPTGEQGLVWVSGPSLMLEYLNKPAETATTLVNGWLRSGDLGVLDEDGYLALGGRADDMEIVSGYKIWPGEVEAVLAQHEAVSVSVVIGETQERGSTVLRALVIARTDVTPDQRLVDELVALAQGQLAPFKVPRVFTFVDELPRTATGKLQRFRLRQDLTHFVADRPTFTRVSQTTGTGTAGQPA
jgi:fatty-acyl-CoA synthase/fatty acid CoA ligase FadD22